MAPYLLLLLLLLLLLCHLLLRVLLLGHLRLGLSCSRGLSLLRRAVHQKQHVRKAVETTSKRRTACL